jgi:regulator of protease activity HflC (stomatin/prohibitin superfamily)
VRHGGSFTRGHLTANNAPKTGGSSLAVSAIAFAAFVLARRSGGRSAAGAFVLGTAFALVAFSRCVTVVPAGHVGVIDLFGRVTPETLESGLQLVNPLARIIHMSVQTLEVKETMDVPSKEGLTVRQRMQFVLQREQQESECKRIEAQGVADFQRIVSQGISEPLLRWKGIEATIKLAESQNAKVVVGSAKDGLPLILGGQ